MTAEATATLRIRSDVLAPEELRAFVTMDPTNSFRIGDPVGRRSAAVYQQHGIHFTAPYVDVDDLQAEIESLLANLVPAVEQAVQDGRVLLDIFVGVFSTDGQCGFGFDSGLLRSLSDVHCDLTFDLYPPHDFEAEDKAER